jgi:hypothetical protein
MSGSGYIQVKVYCTQSKPGTPITTFLGQRVWSDGPVGHVSRTGCGWSSPTYIAPWPYKLDTILT